MVDEGKPDPITRAATALIAELRELDPSYTPKNATELGLMSIEAMQAKASGKTWCGTCGWRNFEDHPRRPGVKRCDNCKEYRTVIKGAEWMTNPVKLLEPYTYDQAIDEMHKALSHYERVPTEPSLQLAERWANIASAIKLGEL